MTKYFLSHLLHLTQHNKPILIYKNQKQNQEKMELEKTYMMLHILTLAVIRTTGLSQCVEKLDEVSYYNNIFYTFYSSERFFYCKLILGNIMWDNFMETFLHFKTFKTNLDRCFTGNVIPIYVKCWKNKSYYFPLLWYYCIQTIRIAFIPKMLCRMLSHKLLICNFTNTQPLRTKVLFDISCLNQKVQ